MARKTMEGTLEKWTNWVTGWQERWFVCADGCLSYYATEEDVEHGARGSINLRAADIVLGEDAVSFEVSTQNNSHLWLRAANAKERQLWVIALGSSKLQAEAAAMPGLTLNVPPTNLGLSSPPSSVAVPRTAIRSFKDARRQLEQHVSAVQARIETIRSLNVEELRSEHSSKLGRDCAKASEACVALLRSVKALSKLTPVNMYDMESSEADEPPSPSERHHHRLPTGLSRHHPSSPSPTSVEVPIWDQELSLSRDEAQPEPPQPRAGLLKQPQLPQPQQRHNFSAVKEEVDLLDSPDAAGNHPAPLFTEQQEGSGDEFEDPEVPRRAEDETFFYTMDASFQHVVLGQDDLIPTEHFLQACSSILPFVDRLGSTTFAPVKADIRGNIDKLTAKLKQDPRGFAHLQHMVESEITSKTTTARNSATDALLWLKRALEFIYELLNEIVGGAQSLSGAAGQAYTKTLSKYHNWMVRPVFLMAMKTVPHRKDFLVALGPGDEDTVLGDMAQFTRALGHILAALNRFYLRNKLDPL